MIFLSPLVPSEGVLQYCICLAQIVSPDTSSGPVIKPAFPVTIVVQHFSMAEGDGCAFFGFGFKMNPPHHILPQIHHSGFTFMQNEWLVSQFPVGLYHAKFRFGLDCFVVEGDGLGVSPQFFVADAHLRTFKGNHRHIHVCHSLYVFPICRHPSGIIHFSIVDVAQQQRPVMTALPCLISKSYGLTIHFKGGLKCQRGISPINSTTDFSVPPSVAQLGVDFIFPLMQ